MVTSSRHGVIVGKTIKGQILVQGQDGRITRVQTSQHEAGNPVLKIVEIRESTKSMERINYNPAKEVLAGLIQFQVDPYIPEADLERTGELTKRSIYYGVVLKGVLDYLNQHFKNFTDHMGNQFMNLVWEPSDIHKIQLISETFGYAEVQHSDADISLMNLSLEARAVRARKAELARFQAHLSRTKNQVPAFERVGSATDVAEAFAEHKYYSPPSGHFTLAGGVAYSYETPLALWADAGNGLEVPYVDLSKYSSTTSTQQNAIIRALAERNIKYELASPEDMRRMLKPHAPNVSLQPQTQRPRVQ